MLSPNNKIWIIKSRITMIICNYSMTTPGVTGVVCADSQGMCVGGKHFNNYWVICRPIIDIPYQCLKKPDNLSACPMKMLSYDFPLSVVWFLNCTSLGHQWSKMVLLFFSYAIYLCFGIPPYFIGAYHSLIFLLAENGILALD